MPSADVFVFHESGVEPGRTLMFRCISPRLPIHDELSGKSVMDPVPGVTAITYPMHPTSRGSVQILDADVAAEPAITANYLRYRSR